MKAFALLFLTLPAFAADKTEVINTKLTMYVYGHLGCSVRAGEEGSLSDRLITQLGNPDGQSALFSSKELVLKHTHATAQGCDLAKLDGIVQDAERFFGFLRNTPAVVTRKITGPYLTQDGHCLMQVDENVKVELGRGISVESHEGEIQAAMGCN